MKRHLLSLAFVLLITVKGFSFHPAGNVKVYHLQHQPLEVLLNGVLINTSQASADAVNLHEGVYNLSIAAIQPYSYQPGIVSKALLFDGQVEVYAGFVTTIRVDNFSGVTIENYYPLAPKPITYHPTHPRIPAHHVKRHVVQPLPVFCPPAQVIMNEQAFSAFMEVYNNRHFDSSKLEMARTLLSQQVLNTFMIHQLLKSLDFEGSRVELAKLAYPKVIDPDNYFHLYDVFWFDSSIDELNRFIRSI